MFVCGGLCVCIQVRGVCVFVCACVAVVCVCMHVWLQFVCVFHLQCVCVHACICFSVCVLVYIFVFVCVCSHHSPMDGVGEDGFVPDPLARYRLLLSAALRLCLAILTSLGIENKEAAAQVSVWAFLLLLYWGRFLHSVILPKIRAGGPLVVHCEVWQQPQKAML